MVSRKEAGALEQQTLKLSIGLVLATVVGSLVFGVMIESEAVILNGIFSFLSLISGGMSLLAARMVARPEDRRFPYGYAHIEPLVLSANALILFGVCFYALVNGVRGVLAGGGAVNAAGVVVFGAVTGVVNLSTHLFRGGGHPGRSRVQAPDGRGTGPPAGANLQKHGTSPRRNLAVRILHPGVQMDLNVWEPSRC